MLRDDAFAAEQCLLRLFQALDDADAARVAEAFAEDGVWLRAGGERRGQIAIEAEMQTRPRGRRIRHLLSNFLFEADGPDALSVSFSSLAFSDDAPTPGQPSAMSLPLAIDAYAARLLKQDGVWRIMRLGAKREFVRV